MEESPENLPKPARRTATRPFFSPRPSSGEGVTGPLELKNRRAAQLFTPPGSAAPSPAAKKAAEPEEVQARNNEAPSASAHLEPERDEWSRPPMITPQRTLDAEPLVASSPSLADDDAFVVEQFEHEEIELTSASGTTERDEHSIEVIAYADANSLLKASANEGERPEVDGLFIESTEFSFHDIVPPQMDVDGFWATEPFEAAVTPTAQAALANETAVGPEKVEEVVRPMDAPSWAMPVAVDLVASEIIASEPIEDSATVVELANEPVGDAVSVAPPDGIESAQALEELKESEPWMVSTAMVETPIVEAPVSYHVADALDRIASRIRSGEINVTDSAEMSDEAAIAAALTALLRLPR